MARGEKEKYRAIQSELKGLKEMSEADADHSRKYLIQCTGEENHFDHWTPSTTDKFKLGVKVSIQ